jgi:DNA-directed RNA polymerase specialized sigma subunit
MRRPARRWRIDTMAEPPPERPGEGSPLDPADERRLIVAAQAGDEAARAELLEAFGPLVDSIAGRYDKEDRVGRGELVKAAGLGLVRALERYDPEYGTPFGSYASWWVRHAVQNLVLERPYPVPRSDREPPQPN